MTKSRRALVLCALTQLSLAVVSCGGESKQTLGPFAGSGGKASSQQSGGGTTAMASSTGAPAGGSAKGGQAGGSAGMPTVGGSTAMGGTTGTVQGGGTATGGALTGGNTASSGTTGTVQGGGTATGGAVTGGTSGSGTATGGNTASSGTTGTVQGGSTATGGAAVGGSTVQGGNTAAGGSVTGGSASGGAASGGSTVQGGSTAGGGSATSSSIAGGSAGGGSMIGGSAIGGSISGSTIGGSATGGASQGGTTSSTGLGGSGGSSGGNTGQALTGPDKTWTWIDFADAHCRNGSSTGLGLNLSSSSPNVMIFLDQGGACFNTTTCAANAASYGASNFGNGPAGGIFDRTDTANPLRDYSFVFIPYCTGDVHAGNNPSGSVPGVTGTQEFVGYNNMKVFLRRLVPTFTRATQVLLTGSSAGGFGALMNAHHVARAFGSIPVTVLDDSGPAMPSTVVPTCLQQQWRTLWGLDQTVLADCGSDCPNPNEYMVDLALHYSRAYPQAHGGLISSTQDQVIRLFFGFGLEDCTGFGQVSAASYESGLTAFRGSADAAGASIATFYISSPASDATHHIWLMGSTYYAKSVGATDLRSWIGALLAGNAQNVGP